LIDGNMVVGGVDDIVRVLKKRKNMDYNVT